MNFVYKKSTQIKVHELKEEEGLIVLGWHGSTGGLWRGGEINCFLSRMDSFADRNMTRKGL